MSYVAVKYLFIMVGVLMNLSGSEEHPEGRSSRPVGEEILFSVIQ